MFYVGQKVVALVDCYYGDFKEGDIFEVLDCRRFCCSWGIRISNGTAPVYMTCIRCFVTSEFKGQYYNAVNFAPLDETGEMTVEEALDFVSREIIKK